MSEDKPKRPRPWFVNRDPAKLCQAKFKKDPDRQCGNFKLKGSNYCGFHGGHLAKKNKKSVRKARLSRLPVIYRKYLNKTLHDAMEEQLGIKPSEQLMILEELALMRDFAGQSVALYSGAKNAHPDDPKKRNEAIMATGSMMATCLKEVTKMAEQAARIQGATGDQYSIHDIQYIVYQLVHIMYRVCGHEYEHLAKEFERRVTEELVLPKQPEGTAVEPHHDAMEMDSLVPLVEDQSQTVEGQKVDKANEKSD